MPPNQHLRRTPSSVSSTGSGTSANPEDVYQIDTGASPLTSTEALHILQSLFGRLPAPLGGASSSTSSDDNAMDTQQLDAEQIEEDMMPPVRPMQTYADAVRSPLSLLTSTAWPQATSFYQSPAVPAPHPAQEDGLSIDGDDELDPDSLASPTTSGGPWYMDLPDMADILGESSSSSLSADTHAQLDLVPSSSSSTTPAASGTTVRARPGPPASRTSDAPALLTREPSDATTTSGFSSSTDLPAGDPSSSDSLQRLGLARPHLRSPAVNTQLRVARMTAAALGAAARARAFALAATAAGVERECSWYSVDDGEAGVGPTNEDKYDEDEEEEEEDPEGFGSGRSSRMSVRAGSPSFPGSRSASPFTRAAGAAGRPTRATSPSSPLRAEASAASEPPTPPASVRQLADPLQSLDPPGLSETTFTEAAAARHAGWMSRPPAWATVPVNAGGSPVGARSAGRRKRVAEMMLNDMRAPGSCASASGPGSSRVGDGKRAGQVRIRKIKPVMVRLVGEHGVGIGEACMM